MTVVCSVRVGPPNPPQLDQKARDSKAPTIPTINRMIPTTSRFRPDTEASTAQIRIPPTAARINESESPILTYPLGCDALREVLFPAAPRPKPRLTANQ